MTKNTRVLRPRRAMTAAPPKASHDTKRSVKVPTLRDSGLSRLYTELLVYILGFLSGKDIVVCQRISRRFHAVIQASVSLQYRIECYLAQVVDAPVGAVSVRERLERLVQWREAPKKLEWTPTLQTPVPRKIRKLKTFGATYVQLYGDKVTIFQPPSKLRDVPAREWTISGYGIPGSTVATFAYDHSSQLLVLVQYDMVNQKYHIHMLSATTGQHHSLAAVPVLTVTAPEPDDALFEDRSASVSICSNVLAVEAGGLGLALTSEVWIWDWKTGELLMNVYGNNQGAEPREVSLLDPEHCIITVNPGPGRDHGVALICLFPRNATRRKYREVLEKEARVVLLFPELEWWDEEKETEIINWVAVHSSVEAHTPYADAQTAPEGIFNRSDDSRLLHIKLRIELADPVDNIRVFDHILVQDIVTPISTLYSFLPATATSSGPRLVPWDEWAARTRVFECGPDVLYTTVASTRYVVMRQANEQIPIEIYDFESADCIRRSIVSGDSGGAVTDNGLIAEEDQVSGAPCPLPLCFGGRLPYRKLSCNIPPLSLPLGRVYAGEDFVVVLRGTGGGPRMRKEVYTF